MLPDQPVILAHDQHPVMGVPRIDAGRIEAVGKTGQGITLFQHVAAMPGGIEPALERLVGRTVADADILA